MWALTLCLPCVVPNLLLLLLLLLGQACQQVM
jgi:hypothetical protein